MIPFPQSPHRISDESSLAKSILAAIPRTYAVVFYSTDVRFGWALLGLSLLVPQVGLAGLAGVLLAAVTAWSLGLDRSMIRSGFLLFNPLLSCSALVLVGWNSGWSYAATGLVWAAASVGSMMLTFGLQGWIGSRVGISVQSLPSVMIVALLHSTGMATLAQGVHIPEPLWTQVDLVGMPDFLRAFFHAFAAMTFQSSDLVGVLIYVVFVLSSPLGGLMATIGFVVGTFTLYLLGLPIDAQGTSWCGYNFLLAGVALGAGYHVPNRSSLLLAAKFQTFSSGSHLTQLLGGGTLHRPQTTFNHPEINMFHMDGPAIFKHAARHFPPFLESFLAGIGWTVASVDALVPHQASGHGVLSISTRLGFRPDQVVYNLPTRGNCVAASMPLALAEAVESGRIRRGDRVLLAGTAAGLTLGAIALIY